MLTAVKRVGCAAAIAIAVCGWLGLTWAASASESSQAMSRRVDELLATKWREQSIVPAPVADDAEFLRRVSLDLIGVIPSVAECREFFADPTTDKRTKLVERLLQSPRHADHLARTWRDIILPPEFDPAQLDRAAGLERWLRQQFQANLRYDRLVAEFISSSGTEETGPALFYSSLEGKPEKLAASTASIFLGMQIQCAECHDHPYDDWKQTDFWSYAAFFAQLQSSSMQPGELLELVDLNEGEVTLPDSDVVVAPKYPSGAEPDVTRGGTRRRQLAIWMASRDNPFLARAAVNRVWAMLFGRGLVHPVDDIGPKNPAVHPQLLHELEDYFVKSGFDLRDLIRVLVNSQVYQRSSQSDQPNSPQPVLFERMHVKTLPSDVLYDSMLHAMGMPVAELTGNDAMRQAFVATMQTSSRDRADYDAGLQQVLFLMNGEIPNLVMNDSESGILAALQAPFFNDNDRLEVMFLAALSRLPSDLERSQMFTWLQSQTDPTARQQVYGDLLWALINSAEFQLNH